MNRVSRHDLELRLEVLHNLYGVDLHLDVMPSGCRVVDRDSRELSPRLPKRDLSLWLHGFEMGLLCHGR